MNDCLYIDKTKKHPCYSEAGRQYARMHIPVAPACNLSCNYCNRKYDCLHETRPGVTSEVLQPGEALEKYLRVKEKVDDLTVVGIAGPGDALANFERTKRSIQLIKEETPELIFCISTNGLMLPEYAEEIVNLGVNHVTITINTVDPQIGVSIYKWVDYEGEKITGSKGAKILLNNQLEGLKYLASKGVLCKVNIVVIKGVNDHHVKEVVQQVKEYGAFMTNIMPLIPAEGSNFEDMSLISNSELDILRQECSLDLKQMYHCQQCRADAIGRLSQDRSIEFRNKEASQKVKSEKPEQSEELFFAVASKTDKLIDQHFGHAQEFLIYKYSQGKVTLVDKKPVSQYCTGKDCYDKEDKLKRIVDLLDNCSAVLSLRIGNRPKRKLKENGIESIELYDRIKDGVKQAVKKLALKETS